VAVVTDTHLVRFDIDLSDDINTQINLVEYDCDPGLQNKPREKPSQTQSQNQAVDIFSSNCSLWAEVGYIIVVARDSRIPLVLRKLEEYYIFVGGCWLIDKEL